MSHTLNARDRLILAVQSQHCACSTDGGGAPANHYVKYGGCLICDRGIDALARLHGLG